MKYLILLLPLTVFADTLSFNIEYTGLRTDGTPIQPDEIAFVHMHCDPGQPPTFSVAGPVSVVTFDVEPGTYSCAARIEDTDGLESLKSNMITISTEAPPPVNNAPPEPPILSE